jgi:predicted RNA-binding protein YlxR (DUF448 family)
MAKATNDLIRIAAAGGGMYVPATKSTEDLIQIAAAASGKGARIIVTKASGKATDDLIRIAAAGKGCVLFDLAS